ncbi:hypothetical protein [Nostoc sp. CCY0012]|uniref:hypothetical protein n=1 Tax=Nostoc sp. CCY0012 TaxID=1056123 RepID=UPI0039C5AE5C
MLRTHAQLSLIRFEFLELVLRMKVIDDIAIVPTSSVIATNLLKIYPELTIYNHAGQRFVMLDDFIGYIIGAAKI